MAHSSKFFGVFSFLCIHALPALSRPIHQISETTSTCMRVPGQTHRACTDAGAVPSEATQRPNLERRIISMTPIINATVHMAAPQNKTSPPPKKMTKKNRAATQSRSKSAPARSNCRTSQVKKSTSKSPPKSVQKPKLSPQSKNRNAHPTTKKASPNSKAKALKAPTRTNMNYKPQAPPPPAYTGPPIKMPFVSKQWALSAIALPQSFSFADNDNYY